MSLNILHIGKYAPPFKGGIENFMNELMKSQRARGHNVEAIAHHHETSQKTNTFEIQGLKYTVVAIIGKLVFVPISPLFGFYLNKHLKQNKVDIIHFHKPNFSCFWACVIPRARKLKWVVHWHSDVLGAAPDARVRLLYPFYRVLEAWLLSRADKIIVTSPPYLESSTALQRFRRKCTVIPLGLSDISVIPSTQRKAPPPIKLVCIGRLTYYKGHSVLLKSMELLNQNKIPVELTIVGSGELEVSIKEMIRDLGLEHNVTLRKGISDAQLSQLLAESDLLVLSSLERTEAFGVVLLEAMRLGKPCMVTDIQGSGVNWVVQDGVNGWVVPKNDASAICDTIQVIYQNTDELTRRGKAGREKFERCFKIDNIAAATEAVYAQIS